jgi:hypothetical protein
MGRDYTNKMRSIGGRLRADLSVLNSLTAEADLEALDDRAV